MKRKVSLKLNIVLSGIKALSTVIFPLITFKYAAAILMVENLGKVNYASSINSFFVLIAGLGISSYAVRELAPLRDEKEKLEHAASQVFSINLLAAIVAYILYFLVLALIPSIGAYWKLCLIFSIQVIFTAVGTEWINVIYEDYLYITLRSIGVQVLCLVLLLVLVHTKDDFYAYAMISMLTTVAPNFLNFFYCRKRYIRVRFTIHMDVKRHIKPILFLFSTNIATNIFVNSGTTILGFIAGDYYTGLYSVATKIYLSVKQMLFMGITVTIPRISYLLGTKNRGVDALYYKIQNGMLVIFAPAAVGLIMLSRYIITLISDETYLPATFSFCILAATLIICSFSYFYSSCVMIPMKMERKLLLTTTIGAVENVVLNIVLVPLLQHNAAAITTFISEATVLALNVILTRKAVQVPISWRNVIQVGTGCIGIVIVNVILSGRLSFYSHIAVAITLSVAIYAAVLLLTKNQFAMEGIAVLKGFLTKVRRKNGH